MKQDPEEDGEAEVDREDKAQIKNHLTTRATLRQKEKNKLKVRLTEKIQKVNSKLIKRRRIFELRLHQRADRRYAQK